MKQTQTYCDICNEEIKQGYGVDLGSLRLAGRATQKTLELTVINFQDICHKCTVKLFTTINKMVREQK